MVLAAAVFIAIGFILVFVEIFLIPGFGPIGVLGAILMAVGVGMIGYMEGIRTAAIYTGIAMGASLPLCIVAFRLISRSKLGESFILGARESSESGFKSSPEDLVDFAGKTGTAITSLRPAGIAEIEGVRLDVLTRGEFIEKGNIIEVTKVEGSRIIVRGRQE